MAFTATLADLTVPSFTPELQEAFKTALRASLGSDVTADITLTNIHSGSVTFQANVQLVRGTQADAANLAANVAVRHSAVDKEF